MIDYLSDNAKIRKTIEEQYDFHPLLVQPASSFVTICEVIVLKLEPIPCTIVIRTSPGESSTSWMIVGGSLCYTLDINV